MSRDSYRAKRLPRYRQRKKPSTTSELLFGSIINNLNSNLKKTTYFSEFRPVHNYTYNCNTLQNRTESCGRRVFGVTLTPSTPVLQRALRIIIRVMNSWVTWESWSGSTLDALGIEIPSARRDARVPSPCRGRVCVRAVTQRAPIVSTPALAFTPRSRLVHR